MTEVFWIIGGCLLTGVIVALLVRMWVKDLLSSASPSQDLLQWLQTTNQRMDEQNRHISHTLSESTKSLNERLDRAAQVISSVQKNIGEMSEIGRDMKQLQDLLKSPKLRGNLGEQILKELLSHMMPAQSFVIQYAFRSGVTVDVAIKTRQGIIPIDAKFPLEQFRAMMAAGTEKEREDAGKAFSRDVKKHIDAIEKKYILPDEGTTDYALMYIPNEAIYYEIISRPELYEYALGHRILPVSPITCYAYLRAILLSFEGQTVEQEARQILSRLRAIQKEYGKIEETIGILQRHITHAFHQMQTVATHVSFLGEKLLSTTRLQTGSPQERLPEMETVE